MMRVPSSSFLSSSNRLLLSLSRSSNRATPSNKNLSSYIRRIATTTTGNHSSTASNRLILGTTTKTTKSNLALFTIGLCAVGQYYNGDERNFYDYRFVCNQDPDDLADFYGSENFMDIYCVMPFMGTLMMRGGYFDEDGTVHTTGLPGEMLVSMVFSDSEEYGDDDDDDDGHETSKTGDYNSKKGPPIPNSSSETGSNGRWFNKRERFKDVFLGYTMWDMVTNFGFETLPDGRTMVYHHGEYFKGNVPPISLIVRLVFGVHARWVAWATEHHLNHYAFQNDTDFDERLEHESRVDMPLFLLKNYAWSDLMAALFGREVEKPSFLIKKSKEAATTMNSDEGEEEEKEEQQKYDEEISNKALSKGHNLPVQKPTIMRRITIDIKLDRRNSNITLGEENVADEDEGSKKVSRRRSSNKGLGLHRRISTEVALNRYKTSLNRSLTKANNDLGEEDQQRQETLSREKLGGNAAWEALRATNNPEAYKAASIAARSRFTQRRATSLRRKTTPEKGSEAS